MGMGKYSPAWKDIPEDEYRYNAYGEVPAEHDSAAYDPKTMYDAFDKEGFDSYGYSSFDRLGNFVGCGSGIDRLGYTELEYERMGQTVYEIVVQDAEPLKKFVRKRPDEDSSDNIAKAVIFGHIRMRNQIAAWIRSNTNTPEVADSIEKLLPPTMDCAAKLFDDHSKGLTDNPK